MAADLVVFDLDKIRDKATFFEPHQHSEGISYVFVNGVAVVDGGRLTLAQRYHFVSGWLPWFADAFALIFSVLAVIWTGLMVALPKYFDVPLAALSATALALFANLDKSGHQRARDRMLQDWVPKAECLQRGDSKSGGHRGHGDRHWKGDRAATRQVGHEDRENNQRHRGPPRWLPVGGEVADDA